MMSGRAISVLSAGFLALSAALSAQTGFVPVNPITPPTVSPPVMAPMPTLDPPVVTAPDVSATDSPAESGSSAASTTKSTTKATTKTTTPSGSVSESATTLQNSKATASVATTTGSKAAASTAGTASMLSMLGLGSDSPLLKALNGSDSDDTSVSALSGLLGSSSTSTDSTTLKKILALLEKQQAAASGSGTSSSSAASKVSSNAALPEKTIVSGGELLRFTVNGYDIAASTTTLVSSILAKDGSFLLTGDRRYIASKETLTETFYLLCRKNSDGTYRLHADVTQGTENKYSFLYRLARIGPLKGTLTGDLLVFRTVSPDFRLDLVIRIISPSGSKVTGR